jgi:glycosyltransferase involved in cell wall biosynthesis
MSEATMQSRSSPLVSVVVPVYRAERFLDEAIESVRAQRYSEWELLLVDDGGDDGSAAIAKSHAARDPHRVRLFAHPNGENRGASASRNLAIRHARGTYIALLDADDVWLPDKLEAQVRLMEANQRVGMLYGNALYWYGWTGAPADEARDRVPQLGVAGDTVFDPPALLARCLRGTVTLPCPCSVVLRRDAVQRAGGFEEMFVGVNASAEDLAFFAKIMLRERVLVANHVWDKYRQHPDSVYARAKADGIAVAARAWYLEWLREYLIRHGVSDAAVWSAWTAAVAATQRPPAPGLMGRLRRAAGRVIDRFRPGAEASP